MVGMVNEFPIGESSKVGDAQINADIFISNRQLFRFYFTGKNGVPVLAFPLHRQRLHVAFHLTMQLDLNGTDLTEMEPS